MNEGELLFNAGKYNVYGTLEYVGCIAESEWHTYKAIETMIVREYNLVVIFIINLDLPVSATSIWCRKDRRFSKRVYAFVHVWYLKRVPLRYCVDSAIVNANAENCGVLGDEYYR